jgi:hypothetical protein
MRVPASPNGPLRIPRFVGHNHLRVPASTRREHTAAVVCQLAKVRASTARVNSFCPVALCLREFCHQTAYSTERFPTYRAPWDTHSEVDLPDAPRMK